MGPFILYWIVLIFDIIVLPLVCFIRFGYTLWFIQQLGFLLTIVGITYAIWAAKKFRDMYYKTLEIFSDRKIISKPKFYVPIIPLNFKLLVLFLGLVAFLLRIIYVEVIPILQDYSLLGNPGPANYGLFSFGIIHGILVSFVWLLFYLPLLAEFSALFFGIHIFLPLKFRKSDLKFDFSDPHLFSGMEPVGDLFKRSAGIYFIGLTIYLITTLGSRYRIGIISTAFFLGGWILGFVLFFVPQLTIHYKMKKAKQMMIEEINHDFKKVENKDVGPLIEAPKNNINRVKYMYLYLKLIYAEKLKVYPFDIRTIRDLTLTAIIPISAEVIIRIYFQYAGL